MQATVGIFGNGTLDQYVSVRRVQRKIDHVDITLASGATISFEVRTGVSKITLDPIPAGLEGSLANTLPGGGNINSMRAARAIASKHGMKHDRIRCLDTNEEDPLLMRDLFGAVQFLGIRRVPRNYVFGDSDDKLIARSIIVEAMGLTARQTGQIASFCDVQSLLLNSAKDKVAVEAIFEQKDSTGVDVLSVVTPSLNPAFYANVVIPRSNVAIAAWDELELLLGHNPTTVEETVAAALRLRRWSEAELHLTMGRRGVVTLGHNSREPWHIELKSEAADAVQRVVTAFPERLCGAGDAYAAGVLMQRAYGLSLLSAADGLSCFPLHVRSALAGCASALGRVSFRSVSPADFHVRRLEASALAMAG